MARLYRLLLTLLLSVVSLQASAVITPVVQYRDSLGRVDTVSGLVAWWQAYDPKFACGGGSLDKAATWQARNVTAQQFDLYKVGSYCNDQGTYNTYVQSPTAAGSACPLGSALSGGTCQCLSPLVEVGGECKVPACPVGQHEEGGACVPDACKPNETRVNGVCVPEPPCPAGQTRVNGKCVPNKCPTQGTVSDQWYEVTSPGTSATCLYNSQDGTYCTMSIKPSVIASAGGSTTYMGGYGVYTGGTCGPSEPGKPTPVDPDKPDGDPDKGTKPPGPNDPKPGDKPGGQPGGPGNNPTPPGPDGKCPDGTYKSNGGCYPKDPPKLPPDNDGKCPNGYIKAGDKCVPLMPTPDKEPGEEKDPSSFGGQCDAVTCDGDAIQCAIVREQYRRNCKLFDNDNDSGSLTNRALAGTDDDSAAGLKARAEKVAISSFDQNGLGWSRTCPADPAFEVVGQTFEIPFSKVCGVLGVLSSGALGLTLLSCLMWVVGRRD